MIVVGARIAGIMTALSCQRRGHSTTLIDRWEPGHPRASSTDYTRIIRSIHGSDLLYTKWVREARLRWLELQEEVNQTLYVECGALVIAEDGNSEWEDSTLPTFDKVGVPYFKFDVTELEVRFPQFNFKNVAYGIYEPESGMIMAHRAVVETADLFVREGGKIVRGRVQCDESEKLHLNNKPLQADLIIVAAGPWIGEMYVVPSGRFPISCGRTSFTLRRRMRTLPLTAKICHAGLIMGIRHTALHPLKVTESRQPSHGPKQLSI